MLQSEPTAKYVVYLIRNQRGRSYIGYTSDVKRRLRQHNGLIVGGAKSTRNRGPWTLVCYVRGFTTISQAMSYEWRWKHRAKRLHTRVEYVRLHPMLVRSDAGDLAANTNEVRVAHTEPSIENAADVH